MVACSVMSGYDRLGGDTVTTVVSQRSESGQGILGTKTGRGKYDMLYDVVYKVVMSSMSCISAGCSVTEHRDTLSCLDKTTISLFYSTSDQHDLRDLVCPQPLQILSPSEHFFTTNGKTKYTKITHRNTGNNLLFRISTCHSCILCNFLPIMINEPV